MSEAIQPQLAIKVRMGAALPCAQVNIIAMTHFGPVIDPRHEVDPRDKVEVDEVVAAPEPLQIHVNPAPRAKLPAPQRRSQSQGLGEARDETLQRTREPARVVHVLRVSVVMERF